MVEAVARSGSQACGSVAGFSKSAVRLQGGLRQEGALKTLTSQRFPIDLGFSMTLSNGTPL